MKRHGISAYYAVNEKQVQMLNMVQFFFFFFALIDFIFKLYIIVLVLPSIKMNPPQVYIVCIEYSWKLHAEVINMIISEKLNCS